MEGTEQPHTDKYKENVKEPNYIICMLTAIQISVFFLNFWGFTSAAQTERTEKQSISQGLYSMEFDKSVCSGT